jgi:drug/metabolite transporter superfamily protein YnfA
MWQGIREHKGWAWIGAGVIALGIYGVVATLQSDDNFGRILAAYGGIFVAGSIAWACSPTDTAPTATTSSARWSASPAWL